MSVMTDLAPTLQTERLILRAPQPHDADAFVQFYGTQRAQFVGGPLDARKAWHFFGAEMGHWIMRGFGMFAVTRKGDDRALGMVGHWYPLDWPEREVGWLLFDPADEGQGIAAEAARACINHAWQVLGWDTIVSYIAHGNTPSVRLAQRLGAVEDRDAVQIDVDKPCHIYRHPPQPEAT